MKLVDRVQELGLFHSLTGPPLTEQELREIVEMGELRRYHEGDLVLQEGLAAAFFVLIEGAIEVYKDGGDGRTHRLASLSPGGILGEIGLLRNAPAAASARATADAICFRLDRWSFDQLVLHHPAVACKITMAIAETLAGRLERTNERVVAMLDRGPLRRGDPSDPDDAEAQARFDDLRDELLGGWTP